MAVIGYPPGYPIMNRDSKCQRASRPAFEIANWDETPFDDGVGVSKLTEALVAKKYSGDIDGTSTTKWLMAYAPDKTATYVGIERIKGTIGGKRGSLVLMHDGAFEGGAATATLRVVSGTDELAGASGSGKFRADPAGSLTLDLDGV
jgi:Protein of unknown function (DUF3224)